MGATNSRVVLRAFGYLLLLGAATLCGCDSTDLPAGWSNAKRIPELTQMRCSGSPISGPAGSVRAVGVTTGIEVDYEHAAFRCGQDVEGFLRRAGADLDVLVQPIDMDPGSVTKCDCLYHVTANLGVESGAYKLTVYRRGDNINHPNEPMKIDEVDVKVPATSLSVRELP